MHVPASATFHRRRHGRLTSMHTLLWILQVLAALIYGASGVMKVFMFDSIRDQAPSFGAFPREVWMALGVLELVCVAALILPSALRWQARLTVLAAAVLAVESLVFIWAHLQYRETGPLLMSAALGLVMAFIAYGRLALRPIS